MTSAMVASKFTPEARETIISALKNGAFQKHAAEAAGVSYSTLLEWLQRGEGDDPEPQYAEFAAQIREAQAEDIVGDLKAISDQGRGGDWRALAWKLERKYPKQFGSISRHEIKATISPGDMTDAQLEAAARRVLAEEAGEDS